MTRITDHDTQGRKYLKLVDAKDGQEIELDGGFPCIAAGKTKLLSDRGSLYFKCSDGKHFISGQADDGIHCIGIYP